MKKMGLKEGLGLKIALVILAANLVLSVITYPMLPDQIILHWGADGMPDGYGSKLTGVLLMQVVQFFIFALYAVIPRIDPHKKITTSTGYYSKLMNMMMVYFIFFNALFIAQNLGYGFNMNTVLMPTVGLLLFFIGDIIGKAEQNWFVGVRTPWTLSNEEVWRTTHEKSSLVFKIWGIIALSGVLYPTASVWVLVAAILVSIVYLFAFSYLEYSRLEVVDSFCHIYI